MVETIEERAPFKRVLVRELRECERGGEPIFVRDERINRKPEGFLVTKSEDAVARRSSDPLKSRERFLAWNFGLAAHRRQQRRRDDRGRHRSAALLGLLQQRGRE